MLAVNEKIESHDWGDLAKPVVRFHGQPQDETQPTVLWDGEWEVTYVTFRDMGAAFAVALLAIYILVVAQFGSLKLPLVILTPVPLTLIGIMIGHWLFAAPFSATSMIGFIALAGIIVRNSILLVDFIRHAQNDGKPLRDVLIEAGAVRFKPILLTAVAAMIGAAVILFDPIFQGLAISLSVRLDVVHDPHSPRHSRDLHRPARRRPAVHGAEHGLTLSYALLEAHSRESGLFHGAKRTTAVLDSPDEKSRPWSALPLCNKPILTSICIQDSLVETDTALASDA